MDKIIRDFKYAWTLYNVCECVYFGWSGCVYFGWSGCVYFGWSELNFCSYYTRQDRCTLLHHLMSNFLILLQSHAGSGVLIVYSQDPPPWREVFKLPWTDGLFDVTWSEANDNVLAAGGGDGRILLKFSSPQPK